MMCRCQQRAFIVADCACDCACVQILGFDILLRSDGMPMLLEVNASPSMRLDYEQQVCPGVVEQVKSPVDEEIKKALVLDTLLIVAPRIRTLSSRAASTTPSTATSASSVHFVLKAPFTRYNLLSHRLSNRFDNRVNVCIHDTTGCIV